jgi:hypothetical protein
MALPRYFDSPLGIVSESRNPAGPSSVRSILGVRSFISWAAESLVPIFPDRLNATAAKDGGDFRWGTFVADLELPGGEFIFAVLILRRNDAPADGAMKMFAALLGITARLGVATSTHHCYADQGQRIP